MIWSHAFLPKSAFGIVLVCFGIVNHPLGSSVFSKEMVQMKGLRKGVGPSRYPNDIPFMEE